MWKKLFSFGVATRPYVWRSLSQDRLAGVEVGWPEGMSECTMLSPLPPSLKAKQENELPGSVILFPCRASQSKPWSCWQSCSPAPCCTAGELSLLHGSRGHLHWWVTLALWESVLKITVAWQCPGLSVVFYNKRWRPVRLKFIPGWFQNELRWMIGKYLEDNEVNNKMRENVC